MVYIGKVLYRFTNNEEIIVTDGDINKALQASNQTYNGDQNVKKISLKGHGSAKGRLMASCSSFYDEQQNSNRRGTSDTQFGWEVYLLEGTGY